MRIEEIVVGETHDESGEQSSCDIELFVVMTNRFISITNTSIGKHIGWLTSITTIGKSSDVLW